MHPNGQIPAYEWALGDVNPPVHAWACWRVYQIHRKLTGRPEYAFLESVFHKLLLNFTWWVNRKDSTGNNIFEGGFLGLDNIGVFDRSKPLPWGGYLEQSDGTSWMAMFCLNMLKIALELATKVNQIYEDVASKFFEHFLYIAAAMNGIGDGGLWDETDGFFYDRLRLPNGQSIPMKVRSMVGLIPLFAVDTIEPQVIDQLPGFRRRMEWFMKNRPDLCGNIASLSREGMESRRLLSVLAKSADPRAGTHAERRRVSLAARHPGPVQVSPAASVHFAGGRPGLSRGLRAGRIEHRPVRRQFELARAGVVPGEFPADRIAAEVQSLFRRRRSGGVSDRIGPEANSGRGRLRAIAAAISRIFARRSGAPRRCSGARRSSRPIRISAITFCFTNTSTATMARAWARATRPGWTALVAKLLQQSGE